MKKVYRFRRHCSFCRNITDVTQIRFMYFWTRREKQDFSLPLRFYTVGGEDFTVLSRYRLCICMIRCNQAFEDLSKHCNSFFDLNIIRILLY